MIIHILCNMLSLHKHVLKINVFIGGQQYMTQICILGGFIFANRDLGLHLSTNSSTNFLVYVLYFYSIWSARRHMQQQQTLVYGPLPTGYLPPGEVPIQPQTYQANGTVPYVSVIVELGFSFLSCTSHQRNLLMVTSVYSRSQ